MALHPHALSNHRTHQIFLFALVDVSCLSRALGEMMGFRFRKIFSLGKGLRINLSKGGFSASLGRPGATLNFGKRGIRPTVGLPGTGLSFTPSASSTKNQSSNLMVNTIVGVISALLICCISIFCIGVIFIPSGGETATSTPTAQLQLLPLQQIIELTSSAAQAQTQAVQNSLFTPTLPPTATLVPTQPIEATATIFIFQLQTEVAQPTAFIYPTNTPFILATPPASSGGNGGNCNSSYVGVCINGNPRLNCTELKAKGIRHFQVLPPDPLGYDRDGDGIGCE